jgi:hypothetical protein
MGAVQAIRQPPDMGLPVADQEIEIMSSVMRARRRSLWCRDGWQGKTAAARTNAEKPNRMRCAGMSSSVEIRV